MDADLSGRDEVPGIGPGTNCGKRDRGWFSTSKLGDEQIILKEHVERLTERGALVPEELEKHLILNSNRLRTFEEARLEIVTHVEPKFGLRIRHTKPSDTGSRGHSDPVDVDAVNSLSCGKGKGSSSPRDECYKCGGAHFQRDCNVRKSTGKQSSGKGKQSKSWSKSEGKGKSEQNKGKSKGKSKGTKGANGSHKGKTSKTGLSGLENSKSEMSSETRELCTDMSP